MKNIKFLIALIPLSLFSMESDGKEEGKASGWGLVRSLSKSGSFKRKMQSQKAEDGSGVEIVSRRSSKKPQVKKDTDGFLGLMNKLGGVIASTVDEVKSFIDKEVEVPKGMRLVKHVESGTEGFVPVGVDDKHVKWVQTCSVVWNPVVDVNGDVDNGDVAL